MVHLVLKDRGSDPPCVPGLYYPGVFLELLDPYPKARRT